MPFNSDPNAYGACALCGKPFVYGETFVRLTNIGCGSSQGYAQLWDGNERDMHRSCIEALFANSVAADNALPPIKKS